MNKNAGRKRDEYEEQLILNIIYECKSELKINGKISYSQVRDFALNKYKEKHYPFLSKPLSDDYWRKIGKQGRTLIDKVNEPELKDIEETIEDEDNVIKTEEVINKLFNGNSKDKEKLINLLRINEVKAKAYSQKSERLAEELEKEKAQKDEYKKKADELQILIFQLMEYSASKDFPIENLMNTGKTRTKPVTNILELAFSNHPEIAYDFEEYLSHKKDKQLQNVVSINSKQRTAADDFDSL